MKTKLSGKFWTTLLLFSLMGQVAWVVENMYLNVFIYKMFHASPGDISLMVAASAIAATLTTVLIGALSDRIGKRKLFIAGGYIAWGISILSFAVIRQDIIEGIFPMAASSASVGITLVILMDCVMTFFGSSANDAAFNAWLTDSTDTDNRGKAEGINSMMPLVAILVVFGGFMFFDLDVPSSWTTIFLIIGVVVICIGILGLFLIKEPAVTPDKTGYFKTVLYGFSPRSVKENIPLYLCLLAFILFNISIQIFMPYLILYYEVSLEMTNYVFIMAPAIVLASVVTALWGRVYDKKGYRFSVLIALLWLIVGYLLLYFFTDTVMVFIGSLLMMCGYLSGMGVFGAKIRDNTPEGKAGRLQGVRIFSQVLLPGIIGPAIGKWILRDAETVVGSDGVSNFVPSRDIFLGALIPVTLLFLLLFFLLKKTPPRIVPLSTPYEVGDTPHDVYPRPTMQRDSFINLNGRWSLHIIRHKKPIYAGEILVPFPPESALSGVGHTTKRGDVLVYERVCGIHPQAGKRYLLHFGAVDTISEVFVNGKAVGNPHVGGYLPFSHDITSYLLSGENILTVTVTDPLSRTYPYGKQTHKRGGMWYTPISGIWQTVWMEEVPDTYITALKIHCDLSHLTLTVTGGTSEKVLTFAGRDYPFVGDTFSLEVESPRVWSPEDPYLYPLTLRAGEDMVSSYCAFREVSWQKAQGKTRLTLNGRPYFFHGLLDQGYFPDGIFLPASPEGYRDDILKMKALGFNMLRKHIKIEPEIFYYYCDTLGMAVFQDMVNNGTYSFLYDTALPTIGLKKLPRREPKHTREVFYRTAEETVSHLYNHPSLVYYTIFNEGWGQHNPAHAYHYLKPLDPSRIWDTASGWFQTKESDVVSEHIYFKPARFPIPSDTPVVLSEFGGYSCNIEGHVFHPDKVYGYKICKSPSDLTKDLRTLYFEEILPLVKAGLSASVLTQLSDVEEETNGILTYDRRVTKPDPDVMLEIAHALRMANAEDSYT